MCRNTVRPLLAAAVLLAFPGLLLAPNIGWAQNSQTRQVMRQKLEHSEALLAALVTSKWDSLDRNVRALQALTMQPGWQVLRLPEFNQYTNAFQRATGALRDAATTRDSESALKAYNGLVSSCVECHRYVARSRIAKDASTP